MTGSPWRERWYDGPEGPYRVGTADRRDDADPDEVPTTVLLVLGRGDSLELRAAAARRLTGSGARVVALEHVGQGASPGLGARPDAVHVADFATHAAAAVEVTDRLDGPAVVLAHSMGGLVTAHLLAARPDRFSAAVLTSPMWGWAGPVPAHLARGVAAVAVGAGGARRLAAGERGFSSGSCLRMRGAAPDQRPALLELAARRPDLVRGGSTWGWVLAASRSMTQLTDLPLHRVRTRVTVVSCRDDRTVDLAAHHRVAARIPGARVVELDAGHDPFVAGPDAREALWDLIGGAVATDRTGGGAP